MTTFTRDVVRERTGVQFDSTVFQFNIDLNGWIELALEVQIAFGRQVRGLIRQGRIRVRQRTPVPSDTNAAVASR